MAENLTQRLARNREVLLLVACLLLVVLGLVLTPYLALAIPVIMGQEWYRYRGLQAVFEIGEYTLTDDEQQRLDAAAAEYVDARRRLNQVESSIRQSGYRIADDGSVQPADHGERLQADLDHARAELDPEPVLELARLPVERADRALSQYAAREGARWGTLSFPVGLLVGLPFVAQYSLVAGGVASCFGFMLASHLSSRAVVNFLLSLPQAMPQFDRDQVRRRQVQAAARSLAGEFQTAGGIGSDDDSR